MNFRKLLKNRSTVVVFIVILTSLVLFKALIGFHPSDSDLIKNFQQNKSNFQLLLETFQKDTEVDVVSRSSARNYNHKLEDGREYSKKYIDLLKSTQVTEIFNNLSTKSDTWLVVSASVLNGRKGYTYLSSPPEEFYITKSIDNTSTLPKDGDMSSDTFYVRLEDNWYLFYEAFGD